MLTDLDVWLNLWRTQKCLCFCQLNVCLQSLCLQLGGWAVSGEWDQTNFNTTLSLLMRNYNTFPFFNLYVGKDPNETLHGTTKRYIQVSIRRICPYITVGAWPRQSRFCVTVLTQVFLLSTDWSARFIDSCWVEQQETKVSSKYSGGWLNKACSDSGHISVKATSLVYPSNVFFHHSRFSFPRHYFPFMHHVRGTWLYWGPHPAASWAMWVCSLLCPLSLLWQLHLCTIACPRGSYISAWPSNSSRYGRGGGESVRDTNLLSKSCMRNWFLCESTCRSRLLPLIGWAVCKLLSIHCLWLKTIMSFYITYLTLCTCPASFWNGCTGRRLAPGTVSDTEQPTIMHVENFLFLFFDFFFCQTWFHTHSPLRTYMFLNLLHTLMPALDSRFSETARNLSVSLGNTNDVSQFRHFLLPSLQKVQSHELVLQCFLMLMFFCSPFIR